jgi:hypothetical protein
MPISAIGLAAIVFAACASVGESQDVLAKRLSAARGSPLQGGDVRVTVDCGKVVNTKYIIGYDADMRRCSKSDISVGM